MYMYRYLVFEYLYVQIDAQKIIKDQLVIYFLKILILTTVH